MPLYDFKCTECDSEPFEEFVKLDDIEGSFVCSECMGVCKRLITNPTHYKHSSWGDWKDT